MTQHINKKIIIIFKTYEHYFGVYLLDDSRGERRRSTEALTSGRTTGLGVSTSGQSDLGSTDTTTTIFRVFIGEKCLTSYFTRQE